MGTDGAVLNEFSYDNTHEQALKSAMALKARYRPCRAVCESTGNHWIKTADAFEEAGISLVLANPFKIKAIAWASVKTDPADARMLAHLLRTNLVSACHIGNAESRGIKQAVRYHRTLIRDRTATINYLHSLTDKYDVDPKNGGRNVWGSRTLEYLDGVNLKNRFDQMTLDGCISSIRHYNEQIEKVSGALTVYVRDNHDAKLLLSVTGIDVFAAALLASEIDGIRRFDSPARFVSWAGMCPTLHQSGDTERHGRMNKHSNRKVNWVMIQCAYVAVVHDSRMKSYYERVKKGHKASVAITHVANKMLTIIWHMLTDGTTYRGVKKPLYQSKLKKVMDSR